MPPKGKGKGKAPGKAKGKKRKRSEEMAGHSTKRPKMILKNIGGVLSLHVQPPVLYTVEPRTKYEPAAAWLPVLVVEDKNASPPKPKTPPCNIIKTPPGKTPKPPKTPTTPASSSSVTGTFSVTQRTPPTSPATSAKGSFVASGLTRNSGSPDLPDPIIRIREEDPDIDYEHVEHVGKGGYGEVSFVKDKRHGDRELAMKKIKNVVSPSSKTNAQREAIIMSRLKNESICRLVDVYRWNDSEVHLVMEPCHIDLFKYIRNILIKLEDAEDKLGEIKHLALGILHGIEYMHGEGVLHRDLKTQNILLKVGGGIKICDFGVSRKIEPKDPTGKRTRNYSTGMGTIWYKSPEILLKHSDYGFETDMWSVACIIGEMFKGRNAFRSESVTAEGRYVAHLNAIQDLCGDIKLIYEDDLALGLTRGNTRMIRDHYEHFTEENNDALDLLDEAFQLDPDKRPSASTLLGSHFFERGPDAIPSMTEIYCGTHRTFYDPFDD